jgi:hypothetical protein
MCRVVGALAFYVLDQGRSGPAAYSKLAFNPGPGARHFTRILPYCTGTGSCARTRWRARNTQVLYQYRLLKWGIDVLALCTAGKAKASQPHVMRMVQGDLTKFAIYNQ